MFDSDEEFCDPVEAEQDFMEEESQFQPCMDEFELLPPLSDNDVERAEPIAGRGAQMSEAFTDNPDPQEGSQTNEPGLVESFAASLPIMEDATAPPCTEPKRRRLYRKTDPSKS